MPESVELLLSLILLCPLLIFYFIFKKHWVDHDLRKAFLSGLAAGIGAIVLTRVVYLPIEYFLGTDLRSFISGSGTWFVTLMACVGIIGLIEESLKAAGGMLASYYSEFMRRPTAIFMGFAGCAMSFSLLENIQYFLLFGVSVVLPRIVISSSAHLFFSSICAVIVAEAVIRRNRATVVSVRILAGIAAAAVVHGFFDFVVFHFDIQAVSGLVISLLAVFLLGIYETWLGVLKLDAPEEARLMSCAGCGAFSLDRVRFCGFCGSRVVRMPHRPELKVTDAEES
ncbi:hypothetical protein MASR1M12_32250 [Erysipelotrichia bacterium]